MLFPVKSVMIEPIINKPIALDNELKNIPQKPPTKKKGITGIIAPIENSIKEIGREHV